MTFDNAVSGDVSGDEVEAYLQEPFHAHEDDPLEWWKVHGHRYPKLSKAARNYLAGRCTSADSERVFSAGRRLVTEFRHNLSAMTIKKCMLLKSWVTVLGLDGELLLKKLCS